jgi:hypothetical protein
MEKPAVESDGPSTIASSTANGSGKLETPEDDSSATGEKAAEEPAKAVEYPKGLQMFFIMLALLLSITLCALDQVSSAATSPSYRFVLCQCIIRQYADILNPDHRCNCHPKNDRPLRQNPGYLMVRFGVFPDARSVPVAVGQSFQILPPQNQFPRRDTHIRIWEFDQRRRPELDDCHCWTCLCWSRSLGCSAWSIHDFCLFLRACEKSHLHRAHWNDIWHCCCRWTTYWWRAYRRGILEMVSKDAFTFRLCCKTNDRFHIDFSHDRS